MSASDFTEPATGLHFCSWCRDPDRVWYSPEHSAITHNFLISDDKYRQHAVLSISGDIIHLHDAVILGSMRDLTLKLWVRWRVREPFLLWLNSFKVVES